MIIIIIIPIGEPGEAPAQGGHQGCQGEALKIAPRQPQSSTINKTIKTVILTKVPAKLPAKGKGKKYASGRDYAKKKQPQVRKAEKGKDYGWLDFLSLPKMKLPNFLGFNSDKQKALKASKAAEEGGQVPVPPCILLPNQSCHPNNLMEKYTFQGVRGKRRILKKHRLTPGHFQTGCSNWPHSS